MINLIKLVYKKANISKFKIFFVGFFSIIIFLINLIISYLSQNLIDNIQKYTYLNFLYYCILFLSAYILYCFFSYCSGILSSKMTFKLKEKLQINLFSKFLNSRYLINFSKSSGEVYFKLFKDVAIIVDFFLQLIITTPLNIIICIVSSLIMFLYSSELALVLILASVLHTVLAFIYRKPLKKYASKRLYAEQNLVKEVNDSFINNDLARAYSLEKKFEENISKKFFDCEQTFLKQTSFNLITSNISLLLAQIINLFILFLGLYFVSKNRLTLGNLFLMFSMTSYFSKSVRALIGTYPSFIMSKLSYIRYIEVEKQIDEKKYIGTNEFKFDNQIEIRNLSFAYVRDKFVLKDFSCKFEYGSVNVIVGPNGSGKSTILKLLNRYIYPSLGEILFDGIELNTIIYESLKSNMSFMPSEVYFIPESLKENICLYKNVDDSQLIEIIDLCKLNAIIDRLPQGLNTNIKSIHGSFSDGEKRRIALARTLIERKKIICLDEPTNHLDIESINDIIGIIKEYNKKYTATFIISTHSNSLVDIADNKVVLKND